MNIRDFRINLKDSFNSALAGEDVLIERGGVTYRLTAELGSPRTSDEGVTIVPPIFKKSNIFQGETKIPTTPAEQSILESLPVVTADKLKTNLCPHGSHPKFCKLRKNGKDCK